MKLRSIVCAIAALGTIAFTTGVAAQQQQDQAVTVITVSDADNIKWAQVNSQITVSSAWRHMVKKMYMNILKAAYGIDPNYEDQKFQVQKRKLDKILSESTYDVTLFSGTTIEVQNDGQGNSYSFTFPNTDLAGLGISEDDNIATPDAAATAAQDIQTAINNIETMFPADSSIGSLKAFAHKKPVLNASINGGVITINGSDNARALLDGLSDDHYIFMYYLTHMLDMAKDAAAGTGQVDDETFQDYKFTLDYFVHIADVYGMNIFNGGNMQVTVDNVTRTYETPVVSSSTFGLDGANLNDQQSVYDAFYGLIDGLNWMGEWMVTGKTPSLKKVDKYDLARPVFSTLTRQEKMDMMKLLSKRKK